MFKLKKFKNIVGTYGLDRVCSNLRRPLELRLMTGSSSEKMSIRKGSVVTKMRDDPFTNVILLPLWPWYTNLNNEKHHKSLTVLF